MTTVCARNGTKRSFQIYSNHFALDLSHSFERDETEAEILRLISSQPSTVFAEADDGNNLPIHIAAAQSKSARVVEEIIRLYPEGLKLKNDDGRLPVHLAAKYNPSVTVLKSILEAYPSGLKERNNYGWLPIHCATVNGVSLGIVQELIKYYPVGLQQTTKDGMLPIHFAARSSPSFEIVRTVLEEFPGLITNLYLFDFE